MYCTSACVSDRGVFGACMFKAHVNKTPVNRGTVAFPFLGLSHEKVSTSFTTCGFVCFECESNYLKGVKWVVRNKRVYLLYRCGVLLSLCFGFVKEMIENTYCRRSHNVNNNSACSGVCVCISTAHCLLTVCCHLGAHFRLFPLQRVKCQTGAEMV